MHPPIAEGIRLFNTQKFFEAHEALETVWLTAKGEEKLFLHGLIQVAAAFHHFSRGNRKGYASLLEKGEKKLALHSVKTYDIDVEDLLRQLQPWLAAARAKTHGAATLPLPIIRLLGPRANS